MSDNGAGFEATEVAPGTGLANIDDRVSSLGGHLTVDSQPGHGARITADVPARPVASDHV